MFKFNEHIRARVNTTSAAIRQLDLPIGMVRYTGHLGDIRPTYSDNYVPLTVTLFKLDWSQSYS